MFFGRNFSAIHIDHITHRMKNVEGKSDGNNECFEVMWLFSIDEGREILKRIAGERRIFESSKTAKICDNGNEQIKFRSPEKRLTLFDRRFKYSRLFNSQTNKPIDGSCGGEQDSEPRIPAHVEIIAGEQDPFPSLSVRKKPIDAENYRQEEDEMEGVEQHSVRNTNLYETTKYG